MSVGVRLPPAYAPRAAVALEPLWLTEPVTLDLHVYHGDTGRFRVNVVDADGVPVDLGSAQWDCDVRETRETTQTVGQIIVIPNLTVHSQIELQIAPILSEQLPPLAYWDLQMTVINGPLTSVTTLLTGRILTTWDVSRK